MGKLLSDDELRKEIAHILLLDRQAMEPYVSVVDDLINLIRTEKLKLLAAVRERVVGEDRPGVTNIMIAAEHAKQIDVLAKLETEL